MSLWQGRIAASAAVILLPLFAYPSVAELVGKGTTVDIIERKGQEAKKQRLAGNFNQAISIYRDVLNRTDRPGEGSRHGRALLGIGISNLMLSHFSEAGRYFDSALRAALLRDDFEQAGWSALDISTMDFDISDPTAAAVYARKAQAYFLKVKDSNGVTRALINLGTADYELNRIQEGKSALRNALSAAKASGNKPVEALAAENFGVLSLRVNNLVEAEQFLIASSNLWRAIGDKTASAALCFDLSILRLRQGRRSEAAQYLGRLLSAQKKISTGIPPYAIASLKGKLALQGRNSGLALREFRIASRLAKVWRASVPLSDRTRSLVLDALREETLSDYISLVSEMAIKTHSRSLLCESFAAQASSRALSLREQILLSPRIRGKLLSAEYEGLLEQFAQYSVIKALGDNKVDEKFEATRVRLSEIEQAIAEQAIRSGNLRVDRPLSANSIQASLAPDEMLLSFFCSEIESFIWIVTSEHLSVHKLKGSAEIYHVADDAILAIRSQGDSRSLGMLAQMLFGEIPSKIRDQCTHWIITADGRFSRFPISALPGPDGRPLISNHTIRFVPHQMPLRSYDKIFKSRNFLGIADPIYNLADSRLGSSNRGPSSSKSLYFARLAGSLTELTEISKLQAFDKFIILTGGQASVAELRRQLVKRPFEVLHFATHFVQVSTSEGAALALSLRSGSAELLTQKLAATLQIDDALVVLDGCDSGSDSTNSMESVGGQVRGWLIGGARAVISTTWPIADDSSAFFQSFYAHFNSSREKRIEMKAAVALQQTQKDMIALKKPPSEWAAYYLVSIE